MDEGFKIPVIGPTRKPEEKKPTNDDQKIAETEQKKVAATEKFECPYRIPKWNGPLPSQKYKFEILKNGTIIEEINNLHEKSYHIFGRLPVPNVDITGQHPTISRFHLVLQYRPKIENDDEEAQKAEEGWYIYDLDSTHGTFLNKNRIRPKTYVRMKVGHQLKLGNSTRCYILVGPSEDEEEQSEFTITELKQQKIERELEREKMEMEAKLEQERLEKEKEEQGINWGFHDDAEEEPDLSENPYAQTNNEELFINDPKKTLRGYFEREGHDLDYRCDELSPGVFICRVELPIDDEFGKPIICEVQHKGKKKECVVQCALEACRILDRHGVLREANHKPRRARKTSESDSDDDNFFDRTGDVEKKRLKKTGQQPQEALTYEQLQEQENEILNKIREHEEKLEKMIEFEKRQKQQDDDEDLDSFMSHLSNEKIDKFAIRNAKMELQNLKIEHTKIQKLKNIAKPSVVLPPVSHSTGKLPLFGKRNKLPRDFGVKKTNESPVVKKDDVKEFQVEEDEDDDESTSEKVEMKSETHDKNLEQKPIVDEKNEPAMKKQKLDIEQPTKLEEIIPKEENTSKAIPPLKASEQQRKPKKPRYNKNRNQYRANIDINDDDEYIDEEKVSTWIPPENQKGDGMTSLNEKFGY
ncbi:hypothetical protein PVAND_000401 [Polypedilum vanderplanki]|uniref:FHA domain-containing protein n=1 Tax=Polypedilum vanderplanki TaxID=319348 RepID=A0A9J6BKI4_POLVA|nr:hypothetical protein PVAND_000401 [Polypedilum vanderplanki]